MTDTLHLKIESLDENELVIRHGEAAKIHLEPAISLVGNFGAPAEFVSKRYTESVKMLDRFDVSDCHVYFNKSDLSITLIAGEQERDTITVGGKLKKNPFLESLSINGRGYRNTELLQLIKYKPHYFKSREEHKSLVHGLMNFEVKTESDHKSANDRLGSIENHQYTKAQSKLSGFKFQLYVPFFEGYEPATIDLTIEIEPSNGTVLLYLVSETFEEFYDDAVKAKFDEQRPIFEPFVIIEK